jgi:hypothetical protein
MSVLWAADHETGDLSQWRVAEGGGEYNSGLATATVSQDVAHSGRYSVKSTILTPYSDTSGVRLFRWHEAAVHPECYYSAWYYFPRVYTASWWNIFQFKSEKGELNDPFWYVQVGNRPSGAMCLYLSWWPNLWPSRGVEGPHRGEKGANDYLQTLLDLPVGQWVHIEVFLHQSADFGGRLTVWQNGTQILEQDAVRTRYSGPAGANQWAACHYSDGLSPSPSTIYIDDAVISTSRIGLAPRAPAGLRIIRTDA